MPNNVIAVLHTGRDRPISAHLLSVRSPPVRMASAHQFVLPVFQPVGWDVTGSLECADICLCIRQMLGPVISLSPRAVFYLLSSIFSFLLSCLTIIFPNWHAPCSDMATNERLPVCTLMHDAYEIMSEDGYLRHQRKVIPAIQARSSVCTPSQPAIANCLFFQSWACHFPRIELVKVHILLIRCSSPVPICNKAEVSFHAHVHSSSFLQWDYLHEPREEGETCPVWALLKEGEPMAWSLVRVL